jgi:hypothetical protein
VSTGIRPGDWRANRPASAGCRRTQVRSPSRSAVDATTGAVVAADVIAPSPTDTGRDSDAEPAEVLEHSSRPSRLDDDPSAWQRISAAECRVQVHIGRVAAMPKQLGPTRRMPCRLQVVSRLTSCFVQGGRDRQPRGYRGSRSLARPRAPVTREPRSRRVRRLWKLLHGPERRASPILSPGPAAVLTAIRIRRTRTA